MKRTLGALLPLAILLAAGLAACRHGKGGGGGAAPPASDAGGDVPDDTDTDDGGGGGGGGAHKGHARGKKKPAKDKEVETTTTPDAGTTTVVRFAINKPTPEPMAPPAVRRAPGVPNLPNLPAKDKYPKEAKLPKPPESGSCGQVWTGTEYIGVDCINPDLHSKHPKLAKVVVPYAKMKQPADKLPRMVDHRLDGTEGPVRVQGGLDCTAFAFAAALDHAYARWTGIPGEFSVMQVWARYHNYDVANAASMNVGDLLAPEADWPYDKKVAMSWHPCDKDPSKRKGDCGKPVDDEKLKSLDKHALAEITKVEVINSPELELVREKLAAGQDATLGIRLRSFATAGDPGAKYVIGQPDKADAKEHEHEVVLAGYAMTPNGTYYLVHNSWGTKWGDQGFAWMHEDILKSAWLSHSMVIPDVEPLLVAHRRPRAHGGLAEKCEGGKLPDSISGLCAGKCPDGSPRHNDVCADEKKKECPAGHVNLTGECVLSAPRSAGTEGKLKWECAPGGCTYEVPKGELDCKERECQVSCPAPDFRLATTSKGLVCVE